MSDSRWQQRFEAMQQRVAMLYRGAADRPKHYELLPVAFEELQNALEELGAMLEELQHQHELLLDTRQQIEADFQSYQDLFDQAPVAYLITRLNGTIRQANHAAAALFHTSEKSLIGRSLALFVPEGERRTFRERFTQLSGGTHPQIWQARMQPWNGAPFPTTLTTTIMAGPLGRPNGLRWIIQRMDGLAADAAYTSAALAPASITSPQ